MQVVVMVRMYEFFDSRYLVAGQQVVSITKINKQR
jgi:hypothetical protein